MLIFLLLFANSTEIYFALAFAPGNQEWSVSFSEKQKVKMKVSSYICCRYQIQYRAAATEAVD